MQAQEKPVTISFTISPSDGWQRLDAFLGKALEGRISREKVKKAVQEGRVVLNGKLCTVPKTKVGPGDTLSIEMAAPARGPQPEEGELDILYHDADLAVINKPRGLTVHPCPSCPDGTLVNRLLAHFPELSAMSGSSLQEDAGLSGDELSAEGMELDGFELEGEGAEEFDADGYADEDGVDYASLAGGSWAQDEAGAGGAVNDGAAGYLVDDSVFFAQDGDRPGIVHRLDKDTTGLLLVALNEPARLRLAADFASRRVKKEYLALVYGVPEEASGKINVPIGRDPENKTRMKAFATRDGRHLPGGREALSDYRVLYADPARRFSLLAVRIHTGRTHQIRVHLRFLGHPIIGDSAYFDFNAAKPLFNGLAAGKVNSRAELGVFFSRVASRPLLHAWRVCFEHPQCLEDFAEGMSEETAAALERGARELEQDGLLGAERSGGLGSMRSGGAGANRRGVHPGSAAAFDAGGAEEFVGADDAYDGEDYGAYDGAYSDAMDAEQGLEMAFCCPPPDDFFHAVRELSREMQRVVLTGNSGCGKSSVLERLNRPGMPEDSGKSSALAGSNINTQSGASNSGVQAGQGCSGVSENSGNHMASCAAGASGSDCAQNGSEFSPRPVQSVPVWSADQAVAESYEVGGDGWHMLRSTFRNESGNGRFVPDENAPVDKKALFEAMFNDEVVRRGVERIVHPIADRSMRDFFEEQDFWSHPEEWQPCASARPVQTGQPGHTGHTGQSGSCGQCDLDSLPELQPALAVAEVPLYFESSHLDKNAGESKPLVVGIHCPREVRIQRLKSNRNWPDSMIEKMESWQWPEEKKMQACDLVLDNSDSLEELGCRVASLLGRLADLRKQRLDEIVAETRALCACDTGN